MTRPERLDHYEVEKGSSLSEPDTMAQKKCIHLGAGMMIVVWADTVADEVIEEARVHHCPILLSRARYDEYIPLPVFCARR